MIWIIFVSIILILFLIFVVFNWKQIKNSGENTSWKDLGNAGQILANQNIFRIRNKKANRDKGKK